MKVFQKQINSKNVKSFIINKNLIHNKELSSNISKIKIYKYSSKKFPASIKPKSCTIPHDVNITDIFQIMNNKAKYIPSLYVKLPQVQLMKRKNVLDNIYKFITMNNIKNKIFYTIIYFYDLIILKYLYNNKVYLKQINNFKNVIPPYEKLGIGISILVLKYFSEGNKISYLNKFKNFYIKKYYSTLELKVLEISCLKLIDYNLDSPSPYYFLELFMMNGIIFKTDNLKIENSHKIYSLVVSTLEKIMISNNEYIKYNPLSLCSCIVARCREIFNIEKWPKVLSKVFDIEYKQFDGIYKELFSSYNLSKYYSNNLNSKLNSMRVHKNMDIICNNNSNKTNFIIYSNESKEKDNSKNKNNILDNGSIEKSLKQCLSNFCTPPKISSIKKDFLKNEIINEENYKNTVNYFYKPKQKGLVLTKYNFPSGNQTITDANTKINILNFGQKSKQNGRNNIYINNNSAEENCNNSNNSTNKNYYNHISVNSILNQSNSSGNIENNINKKYLKTSNSSLSKVTLKTKMTKNIVNKYMKSENKDTNSNMLIIEPHSKYIKKHAQQKSLSILTNIAECVNNNKNINNNNNVNTKVYKNKYYRTNSCEENNLVKYWNKENYSNENTSDNSKNFSIRRNYCFIKKLKEKNIHVSEKINVRNNNKELVRLSSSSEINSKFIYHADIRNFYKQKKNICNTNDSK